MSETVNRASLEPQALAELEAVRTGLASEYDVLEELGRGGMAVVYRAHDRQLDREVALKVLPRHLVHDAGFVERFQREARIAAQLEHPHIVPIYRVGRQGDVIYFAMKHLRGGSLASLLKEKRRLPPAEVRRVLLEVGAALDCSGSRQIAHRDIKPENILFDEVGRCVVTDFGIAKSGSDNQLTGAGQSIGTPRYMSPEQARGADTDVRSDLYSLGIVAYYCLTGKLPFDAPDTLAILLAHVTNSVPTPALPTAEHEELYRIIRKLVAKQPSKRVQTGRELVALLQGARAADATVPVAVVDASPSVSRILAGPRARSLMASASLALLTRGGGLWRKGKENPRTAGIVGGMVGLVLIGGYAIGAAGSPQSLCPTASNRSATAPSQGEQGPSAAAFLLLMDPIPQQSAGSDFAVYYDVCGLPAGTPYRVRLRLSKRGDLLKRMFGNGAKSLAVTVQDRVDGPATRRYSNLDLGSTPPGSYTLELSVLDNRGRERKRFQDVLVTRN